MIVVEGVSKIFDGEVVLNGLDLCLEVGIFYVFSGLFGVGKIILFWFLVGLDWLIIGVIEFNGEVVSGLN